MFHPEVQKRLRTTLGYFGAACTGTGVFMQMMRNSSLAYMNPWLYMGLSFAMLLGVNMTSYRDNWMLKNMLYAGWVGLVSTSLVPLIHMYSMPILFDAMLATGVTMGSLGAVAYNAPSQQFLNMGGVLAIGMGGMLGVSLLSMFNPMSCLLYTSPSPRDRQKSRMPSSA